MIKIWWIFKFFKRVRVKDTLPLILKIFPLSSNTLPFHESLIALSWLLQHPESTYSLYFSESFLFRGRVRSHTVPNLVGKVDIDTLKCICFTQVSANLSNDSGQEGIHEKTFMEEESRTASAGGKNDKINAFKSRERIFREINDIVFDYNKFFKMYLSIHCIFIISPNRNKLRKSMYNRWSVESWDLCFCLFWGSINEVRKLMKY